MGGAITKYILPGLETAGGIGSEIVAPGNPIGLGLAGSGIGQLAGRAAGGSSGQAMGGGIGGLFGMGSGMFMPGGSVASVASPGGENPFNDPAVTGGAPAPTSMTSDLGKLGIAGLNTLGSVASATTTQPQQPAPAQRPSPAVPQPVQPATGPKPISPIAAFESYRKFLTSGPAVV